MTEAAPRNQLASPAGGFWYRWYPSILIGLWVFIPELRRLIDWQVGYNSLPVINLIPVAALLPLVVAVSRRKGSAVPREFIVCASLWLVAFGYAFIVAWLSGNLLSALYDSAQFALPVVIGWWLAGLSPAEGQAMFARVSRSALWCAVVAGLYALYQFVAPPPWDVAWALSSGLGSIGIPEPFQLRVFGPMNSPGNLADFLALAILLTLVRLRAKTVWLAFPLLACSAALALTFVRTAWLELAIGIVVLWCLSPRRATLSVTVGVTALLVSVFAMNLSTITGNPASNAQIQDRLASLNDLQNDDSANGRANLSAIVLRQALSEPLGQGLGSAGTATKLSAAAATTVVDNGYLIRLLEMGVFGFAFYLLSLAAALALAINGFRTASVAGNGTVSGIMALSIAIQVALVCAELSGDHHFALMAVMFWMLLGITASVKMSLTSVVRLEVFGEAPKIVGSAPAR